MDTLKTINIVIVISALTITAPVVSAKPVSTSKLPAIQNTIQVTANRIKLKDIKKNKSMAHSRVKNNKVLSTIQLQAMLKPKINFAKQRKRQNTARRIKTMTPELANRKANQAVDLGSSFHNRSLNIKPHEQVAKDAIESAKELAKALGKHKLGGGQMVANTGLGDLGNDTTLEELSELSVGEKDKRFSGMGFIPTPTAPQNTQGKTANGSSGAPFIPPSPGDALGGIANQDEDQNFSEDMAMTEREDGTGARHVAVTRKNHTTGDVIITSAEDNPDGGHSTSDTLITHDGYSGRTVTVYNAQGQVVDSFYQPITDYNRTQDPDNADADGSWARWWAKNGSGRRPDLGLKNPNDDTSDPDRHGDSAQSPTGSGLLVPEHQLVGDPSLSSAQQTRGGLDPETARKMFKAQTPNQVNPPAPGSLE